MLVREAVKLPLPTVSAIKYQSHVSSFVFGNVKQKRIEIEQNAVPKSGPVVLVDDTLATGETLFAVLQLLVDSGVVAENVTIMVVAEFPIHRGRELLRQRGFGRVNVQSLLIFDGL